MTAGGKQTPKAGAVFPGMIDTSCCANTSVPAEPAQAYWEKNGNASPRTEDCSTGAAHAIRSMLNGPISSHNTLNAAGARRMIACRDGREIPSATPFSAVGIHSNDNMKSCSTCNETSCTSNALVSRFLARPLLKAPTTDWLSTFMRACARRNTSGCRSQNCRSRW